MKQSMQVADTELVKVVRAPLCTGCVEFMIPVDGTAGPDKALLWMCDRCGLELRSTASEQ